MKHFLQLGTFLEFQIIFLYYRISSYSFRENYSFLNLEIVANSNSCHNISIFLLNKLNFCCGNYMRKYGSHSIQLNCLRIFNMFIVNDVLINFIFRSSVFSQMQIGCTLPLPMPPMARRLQLNQWLHMESIEDIWLKIILQ